MCHQCSSLVCVLHEDETINVMTSLKEDQLTEYTDSKEHARNIMVEQVKVLDGLSIRPLCYCNVLSLV